MTTVDALKLFLLGIIAVMLTALVTIAVLELYTPLEGFPIRPVLVVRCNPLPDGAQSCLIWTATSFVQSAQEEGE